MKRVFLVFCCLLVFFSFLVIPCFASSVDQNQDVLDICDQYDLDPSEVGFFISFTDGSSNDYTYVYMYEDLPSPFAFEWRTYTEGGIQGFKLYPTNVKWYRVKNGSFASASSAVSFSRSNFVNLEAVDSSSAVLVYDGSNDPYFFFQVEEKMNLLQILPRTEEVLTKIRQILTFLVPSGVLILCLIVSVVLLRRFSSMYAL